MHAREHKQNPPQGGKVVAACPGGLVFFLIYAKLVSEFRTPERRAAPFCPRIRNGGRVGEGGGSQTGRPAECGLCTRSFCALGRFEQYCPGPSRCTVFNMTFAAFCMFLILPRFERDRSLAVVYHVVLNEIGGLDKKPFIFLGFYWRFLICP